MAAPRASPPNPGLLALTPTALPCPAAGTHHRTDRGDLADGHQYVHPPSSTVAMMNRSTALDSRSRVTGKTLRPLLCYIEIVPTGNIQRWTQVPSSDVPYSERDSYTAARVYRGSG